jgi:hypothetical protein
MSRIKAIAEQRMTAEIFIFKQWRREFKVCRRSWEVDGAMGRGIFLYPRAEAHHIEVIILNPTKTWAGREVGRKINLLNATRSERK